MNHLYVGKFLSQDGDKIRVSFMERRPSDAFVFPSKEKIEPVSADQILVGPLQVSYAKHGVVIHGIHEVKAKWQEYINAL